MADNEWSTVLEKCLNLLCGHAKLDRDKGLNDLEQELNNPEGVRNSPEHLLELQKALIAFVKSNDRWEQKYGGLVGAKLVILADLGSAEFQETTRKLTLSLMHDEEARVRVASGELLGALCKVKGPGVYLACQEEIIRSVADNLERKLPADEVGSNEHLMQKLVPSQEEQEHKAADAAQIFHDTAGWKHLETSMRCLQSVIEGCGEEFNEHITQDLLDLIFQALNHTNRFVRETGYQLCGSLVSLGRIQESEVLDSQGSRIAYEKNAIVQHGKQFADYLRKGLADNWSQVRLAASTATRHFLQTLPPIAREQFYPILLPAMCLNRYYVAEGVRIYSQKSWKMVMGMEGKQLVEKYIKETVEFYVSQTKADNHAVREAACACIAELGLKVSADYTRPHVKSLLDALIICFMDDSWPVRDAACVACGNFIQSFPNECQPKMPDLYPLFFTNLEDKIPSVRQGAAIALGNVVKAYGNEAKTIVFSKVREGLKEVQNQEAITEQFAGLDKGPATFGVVKKLRDNDMDLHTNKQMYSCGSLAPKMGRGGGCLDHLFKRPAEPWEKTDGCINLVAELSRQPPYQRAVMEVLPLVAKAGEYHHYAQHPYLLETICKQKSENKLTSGEARECFMALGQLLGPSILRGRVEIYDHRLLDQLDVLFPPGPPF
ncbi:uncharacterized protein LOC116601563 isoform X2 [Nematostella vectensis]|uniref:uncharacterized protein LOC116601563 isoform X2 n=1 Tax=Nematostella vectensis TaxID=45351 RepID=UPI002076F130|nr:uncharacterized protein LOC116601563 isoform X2 [Nematostella vectensis]